MKLLISSLALILAFSPAVFAEDIDNSDSPYSSGPDFQPTEPPAAHSWEQDVRGDMTRESANYSDINQNQRAYANSLQEDVANSRASGFGPNIGPNTGKESPSVWSPETDSHVE